MLTGDPELVFARPLPSHPGKGPSLQMPSSLPLMRSGISWRTTAPFLQSMLHLRIKCELRFGYNLTSLSGDALTCTSGMWCLADNITAYLCHLPAPHSSIARHQRENFRPMSPAPTETSPLPQWWTWDGFQIPLHAQNPLPTQGSIERRSLAQMAHVPQKVATLHIVARAVHGSFGTWHG